MQTGRSTEITRIPFKDLQSFPKLFSTYCEDYQSVADFYAGNPFDDGHLLAAVERTGQRSRDLNTLADVLLEQNNRWGLSEATRSNIESLRHGAAVVITGQQLGIVGGPIYTQYKTLTTIRLAEHVSSMSNQGVVPVFWLAGEDHDFDEVAHIKVTPDLELRLEDRSSQKGPVGHRRIDTQMESILDQLGSAVGDGQDGNLVVNKLREFYQAGRTWTDAFAMYTSWLFGSTGLIIVSGDDPRLKELGKTLFRNAIGDHETLNGAIAETSTRLEIDYHAQLSARSTNLFYMTEEMRSPIEPTEQGFDVEGIGAVSTDEMNRIVDNSPSHISPNVVLRPLYQDLLFPTVAYVAGPGETSYFGQLKGAYEWADITMPIIYPRVSVSLIESNIARLLEKESIGIQQIDTDVERMFTALVKDAMSSEVSDSFASVRSALDDRIADLANQVREIDPTLEKATLAISSTIEKELGRLQSKIVRSQKQKKETTRNRLTKIVDSLFPAGVPQERTIAAVYFMARYGTDLLSDLLTELPLDTSSHIALKL